MQRKPLPKSSATSSARSAHSVRLGRTQRGYFLLFFVVAAIILTQFWPVPRGLIVWYLALSVLLFALYGLDKLNALWGMWRLPETMLHGLALLGGWPGAMLAQQLLHHKSSKKEFRQAARLMVVVNITVLCAYLAYFFLYPNSESR